MCDLDIKLYTLSPTSRYTSILLYTTFCISRSVGFVGTSGISVFV